MDDLGLWLEAVKTIGSSAGGVRGAGELVLAVGLLYDSLGPLRYATSPAPRPRMPPTASCCAL